MPTPDGARDNERERTAGVRVTGVLPEGFREHGRCDTCDVEETG